jgi:type IX secretion system PorP/SprF family membrane protein
MKTTFLILVSLVSCQFFGQQDIQYNFYMFDHLVINPAYAGSRSAPEVSLLSHQQWIGIPGAPRMNFLSIQAPLKKKNIGVGLQVLSETIGPKSVTGAMGVFAYRIPLFTGKLSFGIRGGVSYYSYNWGEINFKDNVPVTTSYPSQKLTGTADFGMNYSSRTFYLGVSATHLDQVRTVAFNTPFNSDLATHYFLESGKAFELSPNLVLNPSILIKYVQNAPPVVDINLNAFADKLIWLGVSYKSSSGASALVQLNVGHNIRIGYTYQYDWSKIGALSSGSHELLLSYSLRSNKVQALSSSIFL